MMRFVQRRGILLAAIVMTAGCQPQSPYQPPPPPNVTAIKPTVKTIPVFHEENGETEAVDQAVVRARVRGILEELNLQHDEQVIEGQTILFQIEKREYEVAIQAARAAVNSARAAVDMAVAAVGVADAQIVAADAEISVSTADFNRLDELLKDNAIARSEWEAAQAKLETAMAARQGVVAAKQMAEAEVENARAAQEKAEANLSQAELNLEWTTVRAPISGRVMRTMVKRGNLVEPGTELVEIVQNDPIWVNFNISERFLLSLQRSKPAGRQPEDAKAEVKVFLKRSGDVGFPYEGTLDYWDPRVDQDTGTLQLRAVFDNSDEENRLLPGLFVRVRVQTGTDQDALLVPERAIGRDQVGTFVYSVDSGSKAIRKNVTLGTRYEDMVAITAGIQAGEIVIVDGLQRVRPGAEVRLEQ